MKTSSGLSKSFFMAALLAAALASGSAFASDDRPSEVAAPGQPFLHPANDVNYTKNLQEDMDRERVKPTDNGKALYISGGVGDSGMTEIDAAEQAYDLKILFASVGGDYLANIDVHIKDAKGNEVITTKTEGPVLLAKLSPGSYTVETTAPGGFALTQKIKVNGKSLASYVMRYPIKDDDE